MIEIFINDEPLHIDQETSLSALLDKREANLEQPVAVALNGEFVPRSAYATVQFKAGDTLDIVSPVGGG